KLLLTFTCCVLFAIPVFADTVNVPFSTSSAGPFSFQADSFSLSGESGLLALDTASFIVGDIATAALIFGDSGSLSGSGNFLLSYNLTLDGVTQTVSQMVNWTVTPGEDTLQVNSSTVLFKTPAGNWDVTLDGYSFTAFPTDIGTTQMVPTSAIFVPV